jgi:hypothetical protein
MSPESDDGIWPSSPESGQPRFRRPKWSYSGHLAEILSVSDKISSPVIFILFYINIYMFWIKIDFYRLIWLNKNIINIYDFPYAPNIETCFRQKIFFIKMTSLKPFYVETNGALISALNRSFFFFLTCVHKRGRRDSNEWLPLHEAWSPTDWATPWRRP